MNLASIASKLSGDLIAPLISLQDQRNLFSYAGAVLIVVGGAIVTRLRRNRKDMRLRALWRLVTKRTVWRHESAMLDYKLFAVSLLFTSLVLGAFLIGENVWPDLAGRGLVRLFGPSTPSAAAGLPAVVTIALIQLLALDGGYWLGHFMQHKSEVLWQFHKVHHSALVMTPVTEYRQHPVELLLMPTVILFTTGVALAGLGRWFGADALSRGTIGFNLVEVLYFCTFHHLRHSHIDVRATGLLGIVIHSPAHHRIHHSGDPAHFDRNLGYMLSVWDWVAGTLYRPKPGETIRLGLGTGDMHHRNVREALWMPLRDAGRLLAPRALNALISDASDGHTHSSTSVREPDVAKLAQSR